MPAHGNITHRKRLRNVGHVEQIVQKALSYEGVPYRWGGGNPRGWDCSGFINYLLGHDFNYVLPGGIKGFTGSWHGPAAAQYAVWTKTTRVSGPPQAGDILVWPGIGAAGHIGLATSSKNYISALDPALGTAVTPIADTHKPVPLVIRRLKGAPSGVPSAAQTAASPAGQMVAGGSNPGNPVNVKIGSDCVLGNPFSTSIGPLHLGGSDCLITKTNVRSWAGGVMIAGALVTGFVAVYLMAQYALHDTSAGRAIAASGQRAARGVKHAAEIGAIAAA